MALIGVTDVRLGCQGWTEADWQGPFYPSGLKPADRLQSYSSALDFVEIDSSFYSTPAPSVIEKWRDAVPEDFLFSAKLPQAITHDPDPKSGFPRHPLEGENWEGMLHLFEDRIQLLGDKLAVVVVQLPPQWHWRPERLETLNRFLAALSPEIRWAMEFRHKGWLNDDVFDALREKDVALVSQDLYYMPKEVELTSKDLAYIRLQGHRKEIVRMDEVQIERDEALDFWTGAIQNLVELKFRRVIVAANNHYQGFSPGTVAALQRRLGLPVSVPPSQRHAARLDL